MIDTPLEIFAAGFLSGLVATTLLLALWTGDLIRTYRDRIDRLRRGLEIIAALDKGPAGKSAANTLALDEGSDDA